MPGFADLLKIKDRLGAMANDAGSALKSAVTPKAPFPLSIDGLADKAGKQAEKTARAGADTLEVKARSKASTLQANTIGKVTTAVDARVAGEVAAVEKKVTDKAAAVEEKVDDTISEVGKAVDGKIASANKTLDKALGRPGAAAEPAAAPASAEPAAATSAEPAASAEPAEAAAKAEEKDGGDVSGAPLASGWQQAGPTTRARSNAVTIGSGRARSAATGETSAEAAPAEAAEAAEAAEVEAKVDEAVADVVVEPVEDTVVDAALADEEHDYEGLADTEADERTGRAAKAAADAEAEELAQAAGEKADDDVPDVVEEKVEAEPDISDADLAALGEPVKGEGDKNKKRLDFKKKIRAIDNELQHLLGGALTTKSAGDTSDPWIAFFVASSKFKKKLAVRDLKDELAGKEKAKAVGEKQPEDEVTTDDEEKPVVEEASGPENRDETEVEVTGGLLRRGTASKTAGEVIDTTDPELGAANGRMIFVADTSNKLFIAYRTMKDNDHAQLLGPDEIVVGGEIRVEGGKIDFMSNDRSGDQESAEPFVALLRELRDAGKVPMGFNVFEASKKNETTAAKLIEEADKAAPEPEQVDLIEAMRKHDAWKLIAADFSAELIARVAEKEGWKVAGSQIVDATGPLDPENARTTLQKAASQSLAAEAAAKVAAKLAAKGAPVAVDA